MKCLILLVLLLVSCVPEWEKDFPEEPKKVKKTPQEKLDEHYKTTALSMVPPGAVNVQYLGEGWVYFDLDGHTYLFLKHGYAYGFSALTQVK